MTKIHHATAKKALKMGIVLEAIDDGDLTTIRATTAAGDVTSAPDPKTALVLGQTLQTLKADYPNLDMYRVEDRIDVEGTQGDEGVFLSVELADILNYDDLLADILEAADEAGIDPEAGKADEEEEEAGRIVVHPRYKEAYRARGNPDHCGDWLAATLDGQFDKVVNDEIRFDHDAFAVCLIDNGVEMSGKWASLPTSGQKGWVGRYRMNGRQKLEVRVAINGTLTLRDEVIEVPEDALAELQTKHASTLAKIAKAAEAAEAAKGDDATE